MNSPIPDRLAALRQVMQAHEVTACLVPSADPHLSEYLPVHWQARAWVSGFTGSAGTLIVTADHAGLWTDGRYFEQAQRELEGTGVSLMKQKQAHAPEHLTWLEQQLHQGAVLAVAGDSMAASGARSLARRLEANGARLRTDLD
ncbi:MAG TPA: aminopeptidase P family N-terminal domain-containing protein, partial [Dyella sp.]|uniref:aminopeptidase P family N-terminal domain-containing protein n=1 Tax=Dyella sp. TaxID=1869338 RepID=UPI002F948B52